MERLLPLVVAALLAVAVGCSTTRTGFHYDQQVDFGRYRTFAFAERLPTPTEGKFIIRDLSETNPRLAEEIGRQLVERGFRSAPKADADLVISFHVMFESPTDRAMTHARHATLVLDFADADTGKVVWHGWAHGPVFDSMDPDKAIRGVVNQVLKPFPPGRAAPSSA